MRDSLNRTAKYLVVFCCFTPLLPEQEDVRAIKSIVLCKICLSRSVKFRGPILELYHYKTEIIIWMKTG